MEMSNNNDKNKRRKGAGAIDMSTMMYGYVPPQSVPIEQALLGEMMMRSESIAVVKQYLSPGDFYSPASQEICRAVFALDESGTPADMLLVVQYLKDNELLDVVGGPYAIVQLTKNVVTDLVKYCLQVKETYLKRQVIQLAREMVVGSYTGEDVFALIDSFKQKMDEVDAYLGSLGNTTLDKVAMDAAGKTIYKVKNLNPTNTGIEPWDVLNGELFGGGVYVIAARPGMGKTAFVIQLIRNCAKRFPVGFVNAEMTDVQCCTRFACNYSDVDNDLLKLDEIPEDITWRIKAGLDAFTEQQLHMLSDQTEIDKVISKIIYWVTKLGVRLVIIDYLQILKVKDELVKYMTDVQALNYILQRIRDTCKKLGVPFILLSQLNRELYKRGGNKEPGLSDLKGSGMIEEIAFQIAFLHRPEYYGIMEDDWAESTKGLCYLIVLKHRDGRMDRIKLRFYAHCSKFVSWNSDYIPWIPVVDNKKAAGGDFDEGFDEAAPF